jgi:hypothetical protein
VHQRSITRSAQHTHIVFADFYAFVLPQSSIAVVDQRVFVKVAYTLATCTMHAQYSSVQYGTMQSVHKQHARVLTKLVPVHVLYEH